MYVGSRIYQSVRSCNGFATNWNYCTSFESGMMQPQANSREMTSNSSRTIQRIGSKKRKRREIVA